MKISEKVILCILLMFAIIGNVIHGQLMSVIGICISAFYIIFIIPESVGEKKDGKTD